MPVAEIEVIEMRPSPPTPLPARARGDSTVVVLPSPPAPLPTRARGEGGDLPVRAGGDVVEVELDDGDLLRFVDRAMMAMFREWMGLGAGEGRCSVGQVRAFLGEAQGHLGKLASVVANRSTEGVRTMGEMSIEEVLSAFEAWIGVDVARGRPSPHTVRNYLSDARQFLEWLERRGVSAAEATEETIVAYRAWLSREMGFKAGTVSRKLISVRRMYALAMKRGLVGRNPCLEVKGPVESTERYAKIKCLSESEVKALLRAPNVDSVVGLRDLAMIVLMLVHGLRTVEVHRLDVESIDWSGGRAGQLDVYGKRNKWRPIYLTHRSRELLKLWEGHRSVMNQEDRALFLSLVNGSPHTRLSTRSIRKAVDGYLVEIGAKRPGVSCHALRHTFATQATDKGARLETLSHTMGHQGVETTQVYQDRVMLMKENPASLLDGWLEGVF